MGSLDMSQNQNGISTGFSSGNFFYWIRPLDPCFPVCTERRKEGKEWLCIFCDNPNVMITKFHLGYHKICKVIPCSPFSSLCKLRNARILIPWTSKHVHVLQNFIQTPKRSMNRCFSCTFCAERKEDEASKGINPSKHTITCQKGPL